MDKINAYGDARIATKTGHGVDIATQRADDLDMMAVEYVRAFDGKPKALDVGCGQLGQSHRMADAGASVLAMDIEDYSSAVGDNQSIRFVKGSVLEKPALGTFDLVISQRMIHYLTYTQAGEMVAWMRGLVPKDGKLYLSASGLNSELGNDYPGVLVPIGNRYAQLSTEMATKHAILAPVCLYTDMELASLVEMNGWVIEKVWLSPFGNVKLVATAR